jgi:hypothetical protein
MRSNDPQRPDGEREIDDQSTTGFSPGQNKLASSGHRSVPNEHQVTAPAMIASYAPQRDRDQPALLFKRIQIQKTGAISKTLVDFLQRDYVRADLLDDCHRPLGIELPVHPNAFMNVVGCDECIPATVEPISGEVGFSLLP